MCLAVVYLYADAALRLPCWIKTESWEECCRNLCFAPRVGETAKPERTQNDCWMWIQSKPLVSFVHVNPPCLESCDPALHRRTGGSWPGWLSSWAKYHSDESHLPYRTFSSLLASGNAVHAHTKQGGERFLHAYLGIQTFNIQKNPMTHWKRQLLMQFFINLNAAKLFYNSD